MPRCSVASSGRFRPPLAMPCCISCSALGGLAVEDQVHADRDQAVAVLGRQGLGLLVGLRLAVFLDGVLATRSRRRFGRSAWAPCRCRARPRRSPCRCTCLASAACSACSASCAISMKSLAARHAAGGEREPVGVEREPVREVRLALQAAQQVDPVLLLRVVGDQLLHREDVGVVVVHASSAAFSSSLRRSSAGGVPARSARLDLGHQLLRAAPAKSPLRYWLWISSVRIVGLVPPSRK